MRPGPEWQRHCTTCAGYKKIGAWCVCDGALGKCKHAAGKCGTPAQPTKEHKGHCGKCATKQGIGGKGCECDGTPKECNHDAGKCGKLAQGDKEHKGHCHGCAGKQKLKVGTTCKCDGTPRGCNHDADACPQPGRTEKEHEQHCKGCSKRQGMGEAWLPCRCEGCPGIHGDPFGSERPGELGRCEGQVRKSRGKACAECEFRHSGVQTCFNAFKERERERSDFTGSPVVGPPRFELSLEERELGEWREAMKRGGAIRLHAEEIAEDGRWSARFFVGALEEVEVRLVEDDVELAVRLAGGKVVGPFDKPFDAWEPVPKHAKYHVVVPVENDTVERSMQVHVERADARKRSFGGRLVRQPLAQEAAVAVDFWKSRTLLAAQAPRVAPAHKTEVDTALEELLEADKLDYENSDRYTGGKHYRKYVYRGRLDAPVSQRPELWIEETVRGVHTAAYKKAKQQEAWMALHEDMRRRVLAGEVLFGVGLGYWKRHLVGPRPARRQGKRWDCYECFGEKIYVEEEAGRDAAALKAMKKQKRLTFSGQRATAPCYKPPTDAERLAEVPPTITDFLSDDRAAQHLEVFEFLQSLQWFHCRDGCRRRWYFTRRPLPSHRVPCMPGEGVGGVRWRRDPDDYDLSALKMMLTPALEHPPTRDMCPDGLCTRLEAWRLWHWRYGRVMTLQEEEAHLAREAEWSVDEKWQTQIRVRPQLVQGDYAEAHAKQGSEPCPYARTVVHCKECHAVETVGVREQQDGARKSKKEGENEAEDDGQKQRRVMNHRGAMNKMWKGMAVNVLQQMEQLVEMATTAIQVVMSVWTLRTTGQLVSTGHVCNLRVHKEIWEARLPRRPEDCRWLLIDRRAPKRGKLQPKIKAKKLRPIKVAYDQAPPPPAAPGGFGCWGGNRRAWAV